MESSYVQTVSAMVKTVATKDRRQNDSILRLGCIIDIHPQDPRLSLLRVIEQSLPFGCLRRIIKHLVRPFAATDEVVHPYEVR